MYKAYVVIDLKKGSDVQKVINLIKQTPAIASEIRKIENVSNLWHQGKNTIHITAQLSDTSNTSIFMGCVMLAISDHVKSYSTWDVVDKRKKNQSKNG